MNLEGFNKIPNFFKTWADRIRYFANVLHWVADAFSRFPIFEATTKKPNGNSATDSRATGGAGD